MRIHAWAALPRKKVRTSFFEKKEAKKLFCPGPCWWRQHGLDLDHVTLFSAHDKLLWL
jgi:hypothetical protein